MTLNISRTLKTTASDARPAKRSANRRSAVDAASRPLLGAVLEEMTAWNPREFITAFQRWHQGAISLIHLNVLTILESGGPLSMSGLAEALDISVASVTGVVDRMEARGLVKRQRHPDDRRIVLVAPAAGGRKVFGQIDRRRRQGLAKLLARLDDNELTGLLAGHRALRTARADLTAKANAKAAPAPDASDVIRRARAARTDKIDALLSRAKGTGKARTR